MKPKLLFVFSLIVAHINSAYGQSIKPMGFSVNTEFTESHPLMTADGKILYFTSNRPLLPAEQKRNQASRSNIYRTLFNEDSQTWEESTPMSTLINDPESNNTAFALSNDGQLMLFYRKESNGKGFVYATKLNGNSWGEPTLITEFGIIELSLSGSISSDNRTFFFIGKSEIPDDGTDIWRGKISENGSVYDISRIKDSINSEKEETFIFIHPDGQTIYFSSNRNSSSGTFDIYYSQLKGDKWENPTILDAPLNSSYSELGFTMDASGRKAIFSSNRTNSQFDLYSAQIDEKNSIPHSLTLLNGIVKDAENGSPIGAVFNVSSLENQSSYGIFSSNSASGAFLISLPSKGKKYALNILADNYLLFSENISSAAAFNNSEKIISLQEIKIGNSASLKNILFSEKNSKILPESAIEINQFYQFMLKNPTIKIELSVFTHVSNSTNLDKNLSMKRSEELKNQLVRLGIDKKRIKLYKIPKYAKIAGIEEIYYTIVKI